MARRLRIPRSRLYAEALEAYLKGNQSQGVKEALNEVYRSEDSGVDPVLARMQQRSLGPEDW